MSTHVFAVEGGVVQRRVEVVVDQSDVRASILLKKVTNAKCVSV